MMIVTNDTCTISVLAVASDVNYECKCDVTIWIINLTTLESSFTIVIGHQIVYYDTEQSDTYKNGIPHKDTQLNDSLQNDSNKITTQQTGTKKNGTQRNRMKHQNNIVKQISR